MSTIKSSNEHLTLNADGSSKDIKFQANGVEKASISSAGAFTSTTIDATKLTGNLPAISGAALTGISSVGGATGADFNDDVKIRLGTGNDLEIYHNGTQSILYDASDINLETETNILMKRQSGGGATMFKAVVDGAVELYHDNTKKFETTATGVQPTGSIAGNFSAGGHANGAEFNTNGKLTISCDGGGSTNLIGFYNENGNVGNVITSSSSTSYSTSSDHRLKENVDYTWDATTRLKQLKPARFNFIADDTNTLVDGFIAHEVSSVVPEAVSGVKDATETYTDDEGNEQTRIVAQGIDQSKLVPLLVKTIQELEARIAALEG